MTPAGAPAPARGARAWLAPIALLAAALGALVVGLVLGGGTWTAPADGLPDAGPLVGWGLPALRLLELLLGVLTVAGLLYSSVLAPQGRDGVVSREGRAALLRAAWAAFAWSGSALLAALFTLSSVLGLGLAETASPSVFLTYAWDLGPSHDLLLTAVLALVVAVGALLTSGVAASFGWLIVALIAVAFPAFSGHAAGLGDHALAITSGIAHQIGATLWMAGVVAVLGAAWRREPGIERTTRTFGTLALWVVGVLALSGVLSAATRLQALPDLLGTGYGLLVLAKVGLLVFLMIAAGSLRQLLVPRLSTTDNRRPFLLLLGLEVGLLALAMGLAVSLARTPTPRAVTVTDSAAETVLGFPFPAAPTFANVALTWWVDAFFLITGLLAAGLYLAGVIRLRRRGDRWSWLRTASWLLGIAVMIWATNSGLAAYSEVSFSLHMLQHMTLAMLVPILLVLGGPFTLALRAIPPAPNGGRGARELLVWGLHSPLAKFYLNPIVVLLLYTIGLYGLYFTSLFGTLMSSHLGHVLMSLHFILSGYLFYWVIIGVDPVPKPVPYWAKLLLLLVSMVVHSFFALPIMSASQPLAAEWFGQVQPPWIEDLLAETHTGGGIAWGFGEVPALIVLVALCVQWAQDDSREARRRDRRVDRDGDTELDAYNARLARLAAADEARRQREGR